MEEERKMGGDRIEKKERREKRERGGHLSEGEGCLLVLRGMDGTDSHPTLCDGGPF